jgi:hypothetical protein
LNCTEESSATKEPILKPECVVSDISTLTNHLFLWHLTPRVKADRIAVEGFLPKGEAHQSHVSRAIWFSSSGYSFVKHVQQVGKRQEYDAFLIALPIDSLDERWNGQAADEFLAFQPIPPETILCRFSSELATDREQLLRTLKNHLGDDFIDQVAQLCAREDVPWSQRTSPAALLMYLDRRRYDQNHITAIALNDALRKLSRSESISLAEKLSSIDFRFYHHFLRQYYHTYGERHVVRALLTASAKRIGIERIVSICCRDTDPGPNHVARFIADILPHIPRRDLVLGMIEIRSLRPYRAPAVVTDQLEAWILEQPESVDHAPYLVAHALDIFHARVGKVAIAMAARILGNSGDDPFQMILTIIESPHPASRLGAVQAFGLMREIRALDYLEECLDTDWKEMRAETIRSLSRLDSDRAQALVRNAAKDRAGRVRRVAERVLSNKR